MSTEPDRNMADGDWEEVTGDNYKNFPLVRTTRVHISPHVVQELPGKKYLVDEYGRDSDDRSVELQERRRSSDKSVTIGNFVKS